MLHLTLEDQLFLGQPKQVGTHSTVHEHLAVMFEDDGENHACNLSFPCGYFALHLSVFQIVPSDSQPALSMFSFS